jgi:hypothetical protein
MRRECIRCNSRQQAGILDGFETIAHQHLRPNERPKVPIAVDNKYVKIRPKQGSRSSSATKNLQRKSLVPQCLIAIRGAHESHFLSQPDSAKES